MKIKPESLASPNSLTDQLFDRLNEFTTCARNKIPDHDDITVQVHKCLIAATNDDEDHEILLDLAGLDLSQTVELIALGQFAAAYGELYCLIEEKMNYLLPDGFRSSPEDSACDRTICRFTISQLIACHQRLGILGSADISFLKKLERIKNAIARKDYFALDALFPHVMNDGMGVNIFRIDKERVLRDLRSAVSIYLKLYKVYELRFSQ